MKKRIFKKEFQLLNTYQSDHIKRKESIVDLFSVNLFYFDQYNTLIMPAGVLYDPIFNIKNPIYLNYATIGVYLSHEIWHFAEKEIFKGLSDMDLFSHPYIKYITCLKKNYQTYIKIKHGNIKIGK